MQNLNTSTLAALEEMLQNMARPVPPEYIPIHFQGGMNAHHQGQIIGHLNPEFAQHLQASLAKEAIPHIQIERDHAFIAAAKPIDISASMAQLADRMRSGGYIPGWRNEEFAWIDQNGHEYFRLERAAFRTFGLRSAAVHINGFTKAGTLWLGRRSQNKATDPGLLDNLAAGGISADETPWKQIRQPCRGRKNLPPGLTSSIRLRLHSF